ncbi:MAG: D-alanyl-D-alanine carboxypeptidase/D-alanyl-D-alanine endopeptidase, partial [Pyrinomonadaceae bacterium]
MFYLFTPAPRRTAFLTLLIFTSIFSGCRYWQQSPNAAPAESNEKLVLPDGENGGFPVSSSDVNLAKPLEISTRPADVALCDKINQTIEQSEFANARWGVVAISLKDGRVICGRDAQKLFNPASIEKTLTAIVALDTLGADYRWRTSVYAANQIQPDGTLNGDLTLYGQGAPDFDTKALEQLVADLQAKGLKRVKGNVIGDASYFRGSGLGDGWTWNELQWYYGAEASALTFNDNEGFVNVENGIGKAAPDYIQVVTAASTPEEEKNGGGGNSSRSRNSAGLTRGLDDNDFYVWGTKQNWGARVAVHNPAEWAARAFKQSLEKHGITVEGLPQSFDWKSANKLDTGAATELAFVESQTLSEIVKKMNKHSVNLYAELILRTIGRKFRDTAPADNARPEEVRGDDNAGAAIIKKWLREHSV